MRKLFNESEYQQIMSYKQKAIDTGSKKIWFKWYNLYLLTERWKDKRQKVIERCGGVCESCKCADMFHVHHLSYENAGDEYLHELLGVCDYCHSKIHDKNIRKKGPERVGNILMEVFDSIYQNALINGYVKGR